jgi:multiple sugar transport system substrate-binding protein
MIQQQVPGMSRRALLKWLAVSSAGVALAACAPGVAPGTASSAESDAAADVAAQELKLLVCCYTGPETELRDAYNSEFMAANPGVTISMELLPAGQNYFEKLQTLIAAGTVPDLFDMWEGYIQPYARNGALLNLDPLLEKDSEVTKANLLPAAIDAAAYEGSIYALSIGFMPGPISLYYNVAHLEAAGLATPSHDWTWDDVRAAAQALTKDENGDGNPEQWGLAFDLWFVPWLYWIWSNGGDVFNADQTQSTIAEAPAAEALQYWADLVNVDKVAVPPSMLPAMQGSLNGFITGAISMYLGNTWDVGTLKEATEIEWRAVLSPKAPSGGRTWYEHFWCWAISSQSGQPDLAWQFAREFVLQRVIDPATPTVPPLQQLLTTFDTPTNAELGYTPLIELATQPNQFRIPGSGDKWDKISGLIQAELDLVFIGEATAADATAAAAPKIDEELARG